MADGQEKAASPGGGTSNAGPPLKPKRTSKPKSHNAMMALLHCQECYQICQHQSPYWWLKVCSAMHIVVWAKFKGKRYWLAKLILAGAHKACVLYFGKHVFDLVPTSHCAPFFPIDPNPKLIASQDWLNSLVDTNLYMTLWMRRHGGSQRTPAELKLVWDKIAEVQQFVAAQLALAGESQAKREVRRPGPKPAKKRECSDTIFAGRAPSPGQDEERAVVPVQPDAAAAQPGPQQLPLAFETPAPGDFATCSTCGAPAVTICCYYHYYCSKECYYRDSHRKLCPKPFMSTHRSVASRQVPVARSTPPVHSYPAAADSAETDSRQLRPRPASTATSATARGTVIRPQPWRFRNWLNWTDDVPVMPVTVRVGSAPPGAGPAGGSAGAQRTDPMEELRQLVMSLRNPTDRRIGPTNADPAAPSAFHLVKK